MMRQVTMRFLDTVAPATRCRFLTEVRPQARVRHDNVLEVCETGEVHGRPYFATRRVEARTLMEMRDSTTLDQKVSLLAQAADGIHAVHRQGLLHRGVKPSNILVEETREGLRARVMGFGVALLEEPDPSATSCMTAPPDFVAPERLGGTEAADHLCDIYSLGVTSYQVFSGRLPFNDICIARGLKRTLEEEPRCLGELLADFPAGLDKITMKCMAKDPAGRYRSAAAVAEALRGFLN